MCYINKNLQLFPKEFYNLNKETIQQDDYLKFLYKIENASNQSPIKEAKPLYIEWLNNHSSNQYKRITDIVDEVANLIIKFANYNLMLGLKKDLVNDNIKEIDELILQSKNIKEIQKLEKEKNSLLQKLNRTQFKPTREIKRTLSTRNIEKYQKMLEESDPLQIVFKKILDPKWRGAMHLDDKEIVVQKVIHTKKVTPFQIDKKLEEKAKDFLLKVETHVENGQIEEAKKHINVWGMLRLKQATKAESAFCLVIENIASALTGEINSNVCRGLSKSTISKLCQQGHFRRSTYSNVFKRKWRALHKVNTSSVKTIEEPQEKRTTQSPGNSTPPRIKQSFSAPPVKYEHRASKYKKILKKRKIRKRLNLKSENPFLKKLSTTECSKQLLKENNTLPIKAILNTTI